MATSLSAIRDALSCNRITLLLWFSSVFVFISGCSLLNTDEERIEVPKAPDPYAVWLITESEVLDDRTGRDGIPSIDRPGFNPAAFSAYLDQHRRVIGININGDLRAYPHQILDWHEVVNDEVGGRPVAITLSPHSGSSIAWDRSNSGFATEFGVAGLMFRNNVILYDRQTESYWPQMRMGAVTGSRINQPAETYMVVETSLENWRNMYPNSQILNTSTGYARSYEGYAYGYNYDTDDLQVIYPITHIDNRLPRKTRLHGILKQQPALDDVSARLYKIEDFGEGISLITDRIGTKEFILAGSTSYDFVSALSGHSAMEACSILNLCRTPSRLFSPTTKVISGISSDTLSKDPARENALCRRWPTPPISLHGPITFPV